MNTKKILIVEDDPMLSEALRDKFTQEGFVVSLVTDGEQAIPTMKQFQPHLVLLDIMLPHKDGFGILKDIKANPDLNAVPVLLLTNLNQESDKELGQELGAGEYLVKSDNFLAEIVQAVNKHLEE